MTAKTDKKTAKPKAAKKGVGARGIGRKKGVPNKVTKQVREALEGALNAGEGAQKFFEKLKDEQPVAFTNIVSKLIPVQVEADIKGQIDNNVTITFVGSAPSDG